MKVTVESARYREALRLSPPDAIPMYRVAHAFAPCWMPAILNDAIRAGRDRSYHVADFAAALDEDDGEVLRVVPWQRARLRRWTTEGVRPRGMLDVEDDGTVVWR